jgi:hypothetical protein
VDGGASRLGRKLGRARATGADTGSMLAGTRGFEREGRIDLIGMGVQVCAWNRLRLGRPTGSHSRPLAYGAARPALADSGCVLLRSVTAAQVDLTPVARRCRELAEPRKAPQLMVGRACRDTTGWLPRTSPVTSLVLPPNTLAAALTESTRPLLPLLACRPCRSAASRSRARRGRDSSLTPAHSLRNRIESRHRRSQPSGR